MAAGVEREALTNENCASKVAATEEFDVTRTNLQLSQSYLGMSRGGCSTHKEG